ncbi:retrovirus-related pol polyprotein from transposon TNT 1-94 [Tanacetum coccineum]
MTVNMSYLTNYEEIDEGYVAFGGNPKGGKIIGKGTIKTGNLDFENVYFVKELKFNLFSVSQMCDKNNSVLFNDTECIVLSPNFKLTDESQVLFKVLRKNNMYSVDLKNIVPKGGLTYLFAKATYDESELWHRRLGHINFKTMNKLVKGNLVRGLPLKLLKIIKPVWLVKRESNIELLAKAVNTACYVQNRVLVTKPHNKTPYELFLGRKSALGFMRPFGCLVTILNTIDHLGKFNGKADEGFFVGYSINRSGPNWLFDIDALTKSMNYKPIIIGKQSNGNAGTKACDDAGKSRIEIVPGKDYILLPLWTADLSFSQSSRSSPDALEDYSIFDLSSDDQDVGAEADMNNLNAFMLIEEEVYVCQPPGFEDPDFPDRVYKVEKALYGLHQAPRAWYETLSTYLLDNGFQRGKIDKTLFIRRDKGDIMLVQVYVDDIIYSSTKKSVCTEFKKMMHKKFQMSSIGELTFFLGLQVK